MLNSQCITHSHSQFIIFFLCNITFSQKHFASMNVKFEVSYKIRYGSKEVLHIVVLSMSNTHFFDNFFYFIFM